MELAERKAELAQCQTRMRTAEEQANDIRTHLQIGKDQLTTREQQCALLQGDVSPFFYLHAVYNAYCSLIKKKNSRLKP